MTAELPEPGFQIRQSSLTMRSAADARWLRMGSRDRISAKKAGFSRTGLRLLALLLLLGTAVSAQAQSCSDYPNGVLDGFAGTAAPAQLQIDRNCTIRNYPASNPLSTNFSFFT
ncbi:MAG: hypothetical protein L0Y45_08520, partial [Woeseiaceae bacterium]|nr:hypothetical protein [Woeseiaceae bacterium]